MNIAMFTDAYFPRINGVTISVKSYATELTKLGHKVCIVCLEYSEEQQKSAIFDEKSEDEKSPFSVIRIPSMGIIWSKEDRMVRLDKWHFLKEKMKVFQPDIIHINSEWTIGYLGTLYSRKAKIPIVFTFHTFLEEYLMNYVNFIPQGSMQKLGRDIVKFYLKKAELIIAPTKRIEKVVHEYGIEKDTFLLPTGIPSNLIKFDKNQNKCIKAALFKKFPLLKNKNILLYVGRVVKEKNLTFLYDVLEKIKQSDKNSALLFVGGGPFLEELKEIAASRGLKKDVVFTGYAAYKDLIYFYKMASVFVFPSLTETQGLVTIEAMTAGLPVVAIGEMGTVDVMRGDNGGFMVSNDVDEFASKVHILLNDKKIYSRKKADAIEWAKRWSIETLTPKLVDCYKKAIDNFKKNHSS
ncbi:glycosyltransferase [Treponema sp. Marseille-Q3903]|uniref:glycosyltransferase n=1 Tax=Treponema sp. Marseille-Q3903 TaxID=2766703 RepID=UPI0016522AD5|nr:glycosyltransferase [Treponema sp. Marseille-Q3903]MBC6713267.1 glycosyltransferase [Treponema sp. Marseille-Q3903]